MTTSIVAHRRHLAGDPRCERARSCPSRAQFRARHDSFGRRWRRAQGRTRTKPTVTTDAKGNTRSKASRPRRGSSPARVGDIAERSRAAPAPAPIQQKRCPRRIRTPVWPRAALAAVPQTVAQSAARRSFRGLLGSCWAPQCWADDTTRPGTTTLERNGLRLWLTRRDPYTPAWHADGHGDDAQPLHTQYKGQLPIPGYMGTPTDAQGKPYIASYTPSAASARQLGNRRRLAQLGHDAELGAAAI